MLMRIANGSAGIYHSRSIGNGSPVCATLAAQLMAPPAFATLASHLMAPRGVGHVQARACSGTGGWAHSGKDCWACLGKEPWACFGEGGGAGLDKGS